MEACRCRAEAAPRREEASLALIFVTGFVRQGKRQRLGDFLEKGIY
jgi:hypothetical protein